MKKLLAINMILSILGALILDYILYDNFIQMFTIQMTGACILATFIVIVTINLRKTKKSPRIANE